MKYMMEGNMKNKLKVENKLNNTIEKCLEKEEVQEIQKQKNTIKKKQKRELSL